MRIAMRTQIAVAALALAITFSIPVSARQKSSADAKPAAGEVKLPDTAAGKIFAAFLKSFNSGDIETMRKFHRDLGGDVANAEKDNDFYQQSGGITVQSIVSSSDTALEIIVETKNGGMRLSFALEVDKNPPHRIMNIRVQPA
jgi:hypothetical protein